MKNSARKRSARAASRVLQAAESRVVGYGSMRGTVEFLNPEGELVSAGHRGDWGTLEEWGDAAKP